MSTASDYDAQVLSTRGFGSTIVQDSALQSHICQAWHLGTQWELWTKVIDAIASVHDLFREAGVEHADTLMDDLRLLITLANTRRDMVRRTCPVPHPDEGFDPPIARRAG